jgi:hypothetical protein
VVFVGLGICIGIYHGIYVGIFPAIAPELCPAGKNIKKSWSPGIFVRPTSWRWA